MIIIIIINLEPVKSRLCLSSWSGQLSTMPVTRASTLQNSLSMPSTSQS